MRYFKCNNSVIILEVPPEEQPEIHSTSSSCYFIFYLCSFSNFIGCDKVSGFGSTSTIACCHLGCSSLNLADAKTQIGQ